jgi:hypothetical protein
MNATFQQLVDSSDLLALEFYNQEKYKESILQNYVTMELLGQRHPSVLKNLASAHYQLCNPQEAFNLFLEYMEIAQSADKNDIRQLAQYITRAGMIDEGYELIRTRQQECLEKHLDLGWFLHHKHQFKEAFIETEIGRNGAVWSGKKYPPNCPRWEGSQSISNKKICVIGEAGLGDEIIFCRWLKDLKDMGALVYYYTDNSLSSVITRNFEVFKYDEYMSYDFWIPSMSLPCVLQKEEAGNKVYLQPSIIHVEKWKRRLDQYGKFDVLNWTGDKDHMENKFRTIPIEYLIETLESKNSLVSVCMSAETCPAGVIDLTKEIETWDDTLAILSLSERCFTASSSVSVAAGSLGIETHLYDIVVGYFTWCGAENGGLSSWFPNVRVWRQEKFGEWQSVIDRSTTFLGQDR